MGRDFKQIETNWSDRQRWGRMTDSYKGAYGTGDRYVDPEASDIGLDGHIWMMMPLDEVQVRAAWQGSGLSTTHPESAWNKLPSYKEYKVHFRGYKLKQRGLFGRTAWVGLLQFIFDRDGVSVGFIYGLSVDGLFTKFDQWLSGGLKPSANVEEALEKCA